MTSFRKVVATGFYIIQKSTTKVVKLLPVSVLALPPWSLALYRNIQKAVKYFLYFYIQTSLVQPDLVLLIYFVVECIQARISTHMYCFKTLTLTCLLNFTLKLKFIFPNFVCCSNGTKVCYIWPQRVFVTTQTGTETSPNCEDVVF